MSKSSHNYKMPKIEGHSRYGQHHIERIAEIYYALNEKLKKHNLAPLPKTVFSIAYIGRALGDCSWNKETQTATVRLSAKHYFYGGEAEWLDTLAHEAAHAWCFAHVGNVGHNKGWSHIAKILGSSGQRCHAYGTYEASQKRAETMETKQGEVSKRDIHGARCSAKQIMRKYSRKADHALNIALKRYFHLTDEAKEQIRAILILEDWYIADKE